MSVAFGLLMHTRHLIGADGRADFTPLWDQAAAAEEAGFDYLWLGDSVTTLDRARGDCLSTLAALATVPPGEKAGRLADGWATTTGDPARFAKLRAQACGVPRRRHDLRRRRPDPVAARRGQAAPGWRLIRDHALR